MGHEQKYVDKKYEVVGTRFNRPDGIDKVTGKARYGADASAPGQLVGRVLRSPHAHASIVKINTSKAEKLPGVKAIITSADLPDVTGGDQGLADILENCMARGRALYDGHAVAAVAAVDEQTAAQALKLIKSAILGSISIRARTWTPTEPIGHLHSLQKMTTIRLQTPPTPNSLG